MFRSGHIQKRKSERTHRAGPKRSPVFDIFFNSTPVYVALEKKEIVSSVPVSMERWNMISTFYLFIMASFLSIAD
jgi:hypothetical protein